MAAIKEYIFAVVFLVAAASVQSALEEDYPEAELPGGAVPGHSFDDFNIAAPQCCFPDKWQGNISGQVGMSGGGRGLERGGGRGGGKIRIIRNVAVFVDQAGTQIAAKSDEGGRFHNKSGGIIVIFKDGKADFYAFSVNDQKCKHIQRNATFRRQCVPDNSTETDVTLGPADGGLKVKAYKFRVKSPGNSTRVKVYVCGTIMVTGNCLPVAASDRGLISRGRPHSDEDINEIIMNEDDMDVDRRGRGGIRFAEHLFYSSVKDSIDDMNVFKPPTYCNATTPMSPETLLFEEDDAYNDIIDRFVSY